MVISIVARELFRLGTKAFSRYYRAEGKAFDKLYSDFPRASVIGRGVRHGLTAGGVAGSLINQAPDSPGNGVQKPFQRPQITPRKPYKTRGRFSVRSRPECRPRRRGYSS